MSKISKAAAALGRKGGKAGKGKSKARAPHLMHAAALKRWGPPEARFWSYVAKGGPEECWPWKPTCRVEQGYGLFWYQGHNNMAHRMAYLFSHGEFDRRLDVLHKCDNPPCCNPAHLFLGTDTDNQRDCSRKGRKNAPKGEKVWHLAKLFPHHVKIIRQLAAEGTSQYKLAKLFGVSRPSIAAIVKRQTWKHV